MEAQTKKELAQLYKTLGVVRKYAHALGIMSFDFETAAPREARAEQAETMSYLSNEAFKLENSKKMKALTESLYEKRDELDALDRRLVEKRYEDYLKTKNVTPKKQLEWSMIVNQAYIDWLEAKEKADYSLFAKSLGDIVTMTRESVAIGGFLFPFLFRIIDSLFTSTY